MISLLLRRILPLLVIGGLTLTSCVVHDHDRGRDRGRDHDRGHGHGRGYGRGPGRY
ncbi:hypothetical protein [Hymenobacter bucti]|uniref:Lipoprotein n=1 Tax=Hymenobacter bucti TaxID=1844114 RepID=A0ABW4QPA7_9BACT